MIAAKGLDSSGGLRSDHTDLVVLGKRQQPGQGHDLVPALVSLAGIHVEDDDDPAFPVGRRGRRVHAAGPGRPEVEVVSIGDLELVALLVVVPEQVLPAAGVAVVQQDVPVADRPEVGAGPVIADDPVPIVLEERMQVLPCGQVFRAVQELRADGLAAGAGGQRSGGQGVVHPVLLPDAGVEDPIRHGGLAGLGEGNHGLARDLLPVQQERIAGHGDHAPDLRAVVHGDDAVVLDEAGSGEAGPLRIGIDRVGQVAPVDQVRTDGVPPVLARVFRRVPLVEQVPSPLPEAQPVRVVQAVFRADEMVARMMGVFQQLLPGCPEACQERVRLELLFLLFQRVRERVLWDL